MGAAGVGHSAERDALPASDGRCRSVLTARIHFPAYRLRPQSLTGTRPALVGPFTPRITFRSSSGVCGLRDGAEVHGPDGTATGVSVGLRRLEPPGEDGSRRASCGTREDTRASSEPTGPRNDQRLRAPVISVVIGPHRIVSETRISQQGQVCRVRRPDGRIHHATQAGHARAPNGRAVLHQELQGHGHGGPPALDDWPRAGAHGWRGIVGVTVPSLHSFFGARQAPCIAKETRIALTSTDRADQEKVRVSEQICRNVEGQLPCRAASYA